MYHASDPYGSLNSAANFISVFHCQLYTASPPACFLVTQKTAPDIRLLCKYQPLYEQLGKKAANFCISGLRLENALASCHADSRIAFGDDIGDADQVVAQGLWKDMSAAIREMAAKYRDVATSSRFHTTVNDRVTAMRLPPSRDRQLT